MIRRLACVVFVVALLGGCAALPPGADFPRDVSTALAQPQQTRLGKIFADVARTHEGNSGFRVLNGGQDGFLIRNQMIDAAEKTIDLEYYIFRSDATGKLLTDALLRAADRGVRVRVLVDDGDTEPGDEKIALLDVHPGIEIRIFNPFSYRGHSKALRFLEFLFSAKRLDYRMHNKLLVIDNSIALLGGRNVGDEYFQYDADIQFGDDDIFTAGPMVPRLSTTFDDYWNDAISVPVQALTNVTPSEEALDDYRLALAEHRRRMQEEGSDYVRRLASGEPLAGILAGRTALIWTPAEMICDPPDKARIAKGEMVGPLMHRRVADEAEATHSELLMVTPFLVPGKEGMQLIGDLRKRNVRIRILTNSLESTPETAAHAGYMHYRAPLLGQGVELYETRPVLDKPRSRDGRLASPTSGRFALHAKIFVFDRQTVFLGSMNFDQRSMRLNTEIGLIIHSAELAQQARARFEAMVRPANSYEVRLKPGDDQRASPQLLWRTELDGQLVELDREPARDPWQRIKVDLLSLLPLDGEL